MKRSLLLFGVLVCLFTAATPRQARADGDDQTVSFSLFYEALEPLGRWIVVDDYGSAWQPYVAVDDPTWRPYTLGQWSYTDAGWTWLSDEDFGWAVYHYGRWIRLEGLGWAWVPGYEWAPSWVSWRSSADDEYLGWAPLPPEATYTVNIGFQSWVDDYYDIGPSYYTFVHVRDFCGRRLRQVILPWERNAFIIQRSVNITNIYSRNDGVCHVYAGGPRLDFVSSRSREPVRRLSLERDDGSALSRFRTHPREGGHTLFRTQGSSLVIATPGLSLQGMNQVLSANPSRHHVESGRIDHGWQGSKDKALNDQVRVTMHNDAQRAPAKVLPPKVKPTAQIHTDRAPVDPRKSDKPKPGVVSPTQVIRPPVVINTPPKPQVKVPTTPGGDPPKMKQSTKDGGSGNADLARKLEQQRRQSELQQQVFMQKQRDAQEALRRQAMEQRSRPTNDFKKTQVPQQNPVPRVQVQPLPKQNPIPKVQVQPMPRQTPTIPQQPQVKRQPTPTPQTFRPPTPPSKPTSQGPGNTRGNDEDPRRSAAESGGSARNGQHRLINA